MKYLVKGLLSLTVVGFITGPTLAYAGVAPQGDDTSNYIQQADGDWKMKVCDNEPDTYGVHADFHWGSATNNQGITRFDETGGADSACDLKSPGSVALWGLYRHRTVEERPAWNELDVKGDWDYHK